MRTVPRNKMQHVLFAALIFTLSYTLVAFVARAEERAGQPVESRRLSSPTYAIRAIQDSHSSETPVLAPQSELDALINTDGGGACPISAALIAMQTLRAMAGQSPHPQPHRYALELFQRHPELKEGRISNDRFVKLFGWMSDQIDGHKLQIDVLSARNSVYTESGPFWSDEDGPDLVVRGGELSVLAYSVTSVCP